jgi:hypothetical protein
LQGLLFTVRVHFTFHADYLKMLGLDLENTLRMLVG